MPNQKSSDLIDIRSGPIPHLKAEPPVEPAPEGHSYIFSGRAECFPDVQGTLIEIYKQMRSENRVEEGLVRVVAELGYLDPNGPSGEVFVEMQFAKPQATEWVEAQIRKVPDSHVFLQTFKPLPSAQRTDGFARQYDKR